VARFYIENFGCRAAQADGAALERQFLNRGLDRASDSRDAEIVVLNTCTVTEGADKDARASIRRLQRQNPDCRILVTGCYAQRAPSELAAMPGVTWVVGNSDKHRAAEIATANSRGQNFFPVEALRGGMEKESSTLSCEADFSPNVIVSDIFAHTELLAAPVFEAANGRTRPNLKVQDGCDNRCSFCVIPFVRGRSRSLPRERVLAEVRSLVNAGYREVVISGINLGRWGRDRENLSQFLAPSSESAQSRCLTDLLRSILSETEVEKLRISSVEPMDWSEELIGLVASSPRIAKYAHVPMQSGSDAVLRRMHRRYRPWHYREKIKKIRAAMPSAAIGADVMVGFPGETDAEFEGTRMMVDDLPLTYLHVFTYSARPGTPAAEHLHQVPVKVARERNRVLREISARKKSAFMQALVGTEIEAITLQSGPADFTEALTDNYLKMKIRGQLQANDWIRVLVTGIQGETLAGEPTGGGGGCPIPMEIEARP
jgi:threonylcarbamoyladenosine tRNA methylthiotransferase MtaB